MAVTGSIFLACASTKCERVMHISLVPILGMCGSAKLTQRASRRRESDGLGGVGFLVDTRVVDLVSIVQCPEPEYSSRHMWLKLRVNGNVSVFFGVVYMPVENVVQGVKQAVLDEVAEQYGKLKQLGDVFILGDLNARVGKCEFRRESGIGPFGEVTRNRSGEMWMQFAEREELVFLNGRKGGCGVEFTRIESAGREGVLDYIIGPKRMWKRGDVKRFVVAQGVNDFIGSDHRLVFAELEVRARVRRWEMSAGGNVAHSRAERERGVIGRKYCPSFRKC